MAKDIPYHHPLNELHLLDPDLGHRMKAVIEELTPAPPPEFIRWLVDEIQWGLNQEISFGLALAEGYLSLLGRNDRGLLKRYGRLIRNAGKKGPTFGRLMARHLVPVLARKDDDLLKRFNQAVAVMTAKGTYTLKAPLASLEQMLNAGEALAAAEYLDLLHTTFSQELSYNQSQHLSLSLPKAVLGFRSEKRFWQIGMLHRIVRHDIDLVDAFLDGMFKGLQLLSQEALAEFVSKGLDQARRDSKAGRTFLNLDSALGIDVLSELQKAASLHEVQFQLNRYLRARTGRSLAVRPLSQLTQQSNEITQAPIRVCSDGRFVYLPEEIERFDSRSDNVKLYRCLVRFESGHAEFGTYDFDLQKLLDRWHRRANGKTLLWPSLEPDNPQPAMQSDMQFFFSSFPDPGLASDLFTVYEHGRIRRRITGHYPGIIREFLPLLQHEADRMTPAAEARHPVRLLYAEIALGSSALRTATLDSNARERLVELVERFNREIDDAHAPVEVSGELTMASYRVVEKLLAGENLINEGYQPIALPFGRSLNPALCHLSRRAFEQTAHILKEKLVQMGYPVYRSEVRKYLEDNQGMLSTDDLHELIRMSAKHPHGESSVDAPTRIALNAIQLSEIAAGLDMPAACPAAPRSAVFWYPEWDGRLGGYLHNYVRVVDRTIDAGQSDFYARTLERYRGLVKQIRYAFELIRPEGLKLYRRWIEGDAFDYRALLDFAIDRKARRTPSERLYLKRVKESRDVAALLLVDLSRSTDNPVPESPATVLDVEKEAIVLFSEALEVVGDAYAIAGFSGTGRLGVDYFHIKDFNEPLDTPIRSRINAMTPQRNTRMGAAIRHAATQFAQSEARVRLLIVLGDGFPNDLNYKKAYAVEDTRKAIAELRGRYIHVHAITVNLQTNGSSKLDEIYGDIHHTVIANVTELPDKLLRIYGKLTQR